MTAGALWFSACAILALAGALSTVAASNPVRAAIGLLGTIIGIAGLFLKLEAQFLAAIQLIVYAGAVVVLFVFVIMLLGSDATSTSEKPTPAKVVSGALLALMLGGIAMVLRPAETGTTGFPPALADHGSVEAVGGLLFTKGIVPFEIATILLIVAVVGAISVARGKQGVRKRRGPVADPRDLFVGPVGGEGDQ